VLILIRPKSLPYTRYQRSWKKISPWFISAVWSLNCLLTAVLAGVITLIVMALLLNRIINPGPDLKFKQMTGLEWPESAKIKIITSGGENFLFDREYYIVFEADHEALESLVSNPPPWRHRRWEVGPIPSEIPYGIGEPAVISSNSENIWYVAKEYCCQDQPFHSGEVLIIDLDSNRVLLKSWDY
jgi:hypothetical protein